MSFQAHHETADRYKLGLMRLTSCKHVFQNELPLPLLRRVLHARLIHTQSHAWFEYLFYLPPDVKTLIPRG